MGPQDLVQSLVPADAAGPAPVPSSPGGVAGAPMPAAGDAGPGGNPYPTTDPEFVDNLLEQVLAAQKQDQSHLATDQNSALGQSKMMQALMQGAPMGPGAGQDAAALGQDPGVLA